MNIFRADLHIHSCLSPCGSLDSSPANIVQAAIERGLDIIAIADHNSLLHCKITSEIAKKNGLHLIYGTEVNTSEEVHALALFGDETSADEFQKFLESNLTKIENDPVLFGDQPVLDIDENIIDMYPWLLISALQTDIYETMEKVHSLDGLFIPAHVDKKTNSIYSQLGIFPPDMNCDAVEIFFPEKKEETYKQMFIPESMPFVVNSDAHYIEDIGKKHCNMYMERRNWEEIKMAIRCENNRKVFWK
ncbi:MAG: PHP domain-containing protein [Bacteroidales bacterium]|nr:PHP domain-containing protein [Bacteroidales bacterium]